MESDTGWPEVGKEAMGSGQSAFGLPTFMSLCITGSSVASMQGLDLTGLSVDSVEEPDPEDSSG